MKVTEWKSLLYDVLDLQKKVFTTFSMERCFEVRFCFKFVAFYSGSFLHREIICGKGNSAYLLVLLILRKLTGSKFRFENFEILNLKNFIIVDDVR